MQQFLNIPTMQDSNIKHKLFHDIPDIKGVRTDYQDDDIIIIGKADIAPIKQMLKTGLNMMLICLDGHLDMMLNEQPVHLCAGTLLCCPSEAIITNVIPSDDFSFTTLAISNHALQSILIGNMDVWNQVVYRYKMYAFQMEEGDFTIMKKFHELMNFCLEYSNPTVDYAFQKELVNGLTSTLLNSYSRKMRQALEAQQETNLHSLDLFNRFLELIQQREVKRLPIQQYASELCISSKYLSDICKKHSGKTAGQWIQEYTLADVTYYLKSSQLSIKEISIKMGFPNNSFFSKYVRDHFHLSPMEYRQKLQNSMRSGTAPASPTSGNE